MDTNQENSAEKSTNIYLEFNGKLPSDVFQNQVFFRVANLQKRNPLVQVNDTLFKGSFDHSMGTNLFFEEADSNPQTGSVFDQQGPIHLKYLVNSTKLLNLQQVKIPQSKVNIPNEVKDINYNLNWDYNKLLEKLENGTLQPEDILSEEIPAPKLVKEENDDDMEDNVQNNEGHLEPQTQDEQEKEQEEMFENIVPSNNLETEYEQLNILARRPVHRVEIPEIVAECDKKYEKAYEYHNIERQILKPRDGFISEVLQVDEDTLADCVDIDRCVLFGLIQPSSDCPRKLTKEEKEKLLTLENFDNLSFAGRYYVLEMLIDNLEKYIASISKTKLDVKDEFGRTVMQTLEVYKKLREAVKNRLQEIKYFLDDISEEMDTQNIEKVTDTLADV